MLKICEVKHPKVFLFKPFALIDNNVHINNIDLFIDIWYRDIRSINRLSDPKRSKMTFANQPVLRTLLTVMFAAVVSFYGWIVYVFATAASTSANGWPLWMMSATVTSAVAMAVISHVGWVQKYYYFRKLRKQLSDLLSNGDMIELPERHGVNVTVVRTARPGVYAVAVGDEEYEIEHEDVSHFRKRTITESLPNGAGLVDRPMLQLFLPSRRRLFRSLVRFTR